MTIRRETRGRPLIALLLVLGGWIVVRAMLWDGTAFIPAATPALAALPPAVVAKGQPAQLANAVASQPVVEAQRRSFDPRNAAVDAIGYRPALPAAFGPLVRLQAPALGTMVVPAGRPAGFAVPVFRKAIVPVRIAAAHQMLWMAMLSQVPIPMGLMAATMSEPIAAPFYPAGHEPARASRWSGDGWLLLRRGGDVSLVTGAAPSTYGASQAGAVLRYRLAPANGHRPAVYLRTTAALNGSGEREAALGFSARPFARVPVTAAAELRATSEPGGTHLRPAVMAITELAPFDLPRKFRGEAYAQAGYVAGYYSTAFVDGQLRVDRGVASIGKAELRAGGGAWGGAQKGASRLDVGPAATMGMGFGKSALAKLAVDWRFRVAGDAAPASEPALTLSAGF